MRHGFVVLLMFTAVRLNAQPADQFVFQHIDQSDGLLHNNVVGIQQDARGFIWVRSQGGLQRYDGSRFVNYPTLIDNPMNGPPYDGGIFVDSVKNELLLIGKSQMQKLALASNRLRTYTLDELRSLQTGTEEAYIAQDGRKYWLRPYGFFPAGRENADLFPPVLHTNTGRRGESNTIFGDSIHKQVWMSMGGGLMLVDGNSHRIFNNDFNPLHNLLLERCRQQQIMPRYIMMDSRDNFWISTWGPFFYRFDPANGKMNKYDLTSIKRRQAGNHDVSETALVTYMFEDRSGKIWIATENAGLLMYLRDKNDFSALTADLKDRNALHYNYKIYTILQDKEENLWVGTDKGINIFNPSRQFFRSLQHREDQPSIRKAEITSVGEAANGDLLVGTWGAGFSVYDSLWNFKKNIVAAGPLDYNLVWCFVKPDSGITWAGCQHGTIHIYDAVKGTIKTIKPPELMGSTIRCMLKDRAGNVWFGLHNGRIAEWRKAENDFIRFRENDPSSSGSMPTVYSIFIDSHGNFWAVTDAGFKLFDPVKRNFSRIYLPRENDPNSISAISCQAIEQVDDSTLLVGTTFGGINYFSIPTGRFTHLGTNEGLPSNTVYSLKKDAAGYVWFTTDYNIFKFKPGSRVFIRYNLNTAEVNSSFVANGFYPLRGNSWVTTSGTEVIGFKPLADSVRPGRDLVNISGLRIFDSLVFIDSFLFQRKPLILTSRQNFLTFQYASLHFSRLHQTKYFYRLSSVNDDWVSAGSRNSAAYTDLAPGKYVFSVRTDQEGSLSPFSTLEVIILPAYWQTWWFRSLCLLLGAIGLWWLVRRRVKRIRLEAELKQKMIEFKMVALRAQMNPHFIFNCLNSIDNLIQLDEKEKATLYLSKFARLIRATLEHSGQTAVPCWKDMETLELYLELESLRFDNKFSWKLNIAREILQGDYKVPPLIIQPFVENAIHHGLLNKIDDNKQLLVDVSVTGNRIHFMIEDNGVGRARANTYKEMNAASHHSMGLQITKDRINLFNRNETDSVTIVDLLNEQQEPVGTKVNIDLLNLS